MTQQIPDKLIFENKKYYLNDYLLDGYFREFPEKTPKAEILCTGLWRGYIATFKIKNKELIIHEIESLINIDFNTKSWRDEIFPNNKFEWYSGLIRIDDFRGEFDREPENGIFEYLQIEEGNLIQKRIFNYDELQKFKKEQYEYFLLSDEIEKVYDLWRNNNENGIINKENINKIIFENIMHYTRKVYVD